MKKLSSIFNILILITAIASIIGFIYFYVTNKLNTPADKDSVHEEVLGNLYRNTKYKFRIKFPENWKIEKGDGRNILVKASNTNGSSINIYVKDMGIEFGDISQLMSLDEWANTIVEKFTTARIISKSEIFLDNKKAYLVQYTINYKTLDQEIDMIFNNVSIINKTFTYAITASSGKEEFESERETLDRSVRTFVIEN
jgi:hypothetical protein